MQQGLHQLAQLGGEDPLHTMLQAAEGAQHAASPAAHAAAAAAGRRGRPVLWQEESPAVPVRAGEPQAGRLLPEGDLLCEILMGRASPPSNPSPPACLPPIALWQHPVPGMQVPAPHNFPPLVAQPSPQRGRAARAASVPLTDDEGRRKVPGQRRKVRAGLQTADLVLRHAGQAALKRAPPNSGGITQISAHAPRTPPPHPAPPTAETDVERG